MATPASSKQRMEQQRQIEGDDGAHRTYGARPAFTLPSSGRSERSSRSRSVYVPPSKRREQGIEVKQSMLRHLS